MPWLNRQRVDYRQFCIDGIFSLRSLIITLGTYSHIIFGGKSGALRTEGGVSKIYGGAGFNFGIPP